MEAVAQTLRQTWQRMLPALVVSVFYFGVLVYPLLRMLTAAFPTWQPDTGELLVIMVGPLVARMAYELAPSPATRWLSALSLTWLGVCFISFNLVLLWEVVNALLSLPRQASGFALLAATTVLSVAGFVNAQLIRIKPVSIDAQGHPLSNRRIAQISDVHVGSRSGRLLRRVVRKVNNAQPNLVVITGDLIDFRNISEQELAALQQLAAPAFFVIGNHERYVDLEAICERLTRLNIRVLRNESLDLGDIQLVGIDDAESKTQVRNTLPRISPHPDRYKVVLYHRPDGAEDAARWGANLMLCGHTHHGQIVPFNFVVRRVFPKISGLYRVGDLQLYVSPGTGTWGPILRLGSRSEIGIMELN